MIGGFETYDGRPSRRPPQVLTTRQQQLEVECETKTKDDVFVLIRAAVQYKIDGTLTANMHTSPARPRV